MSALAGDADLDGDVDFLDYLTTKGSFGMDTGATWADGDFDGDADVDFYDYLAVKANLEQSVSSPQPVHRYVDVGDGDPFLPTNGTQAWAGDPFGTLEGDTQNTSTGRAIKVTHKGVSSETSLTDRLPSPIDLTDMMAVVRFYIHPGEGIASGDGFRYFQLRLYDSRGVGANMLRFEFWWDTAVRSVGSGFAGWYEVAFPVSWMGTYGTGADVTRIQYVRVRAVTANPTYTPSWTLDYVLFYASPLPAGMYAIRVDCELPSVLQAAEYARSRGVYLSIGINVKTMGYPNCLTWAQVRQLQRMGHEIVLYAGDRPWSAWSQKTQEEKIALLEYARTAFQDNGLGADCASIVFLPGGSGWSTADDEMLQPQYLICHSGEGTWGRDGVLGGLWDAGRLDWTLFSTSPTPDGMAPAALTDLIARAERERLLLIFGTHTKTAEDIATFKASLDLLTASTLISRTFGQIVWGDVPWR